MRPGLVAQGQIRIPFYAGENHSAVSITCELSLIWGGGGFPNRRNFCETFQEQKAAWPAFPHPFQPASLTHPVYMQQTVPKYWARNRMCLLEQQAWERGGTPLHKVK